MPNLYDSIVGLGGTPVWTAVPKGHITADLTLYVAPGGSDTTGTGTSGNPMATVNGALGLIKDAYISNSATVTISLAAGQYSNWTNQYMNHPCGQRINVSGTVLGVAINGTVTRSGSAGAWSATIPCADTSSFTVNDYILVFAGTGGTNWQGLLGTHKITSISTNTSITVSVKSYDCPNSANFTGTVYAIKSTITFLASNHGFSFSRGPSVNYLYGVTCVGQSTSGYYGLAATSGAYAYCAACCFINWTNGVGGNHAFIGGDNLATSNCDNGALLQWGTGYFNSSAFGGISWGILSAYGSTVYAPSTHSIRNGATRAGAGQGAAYGSQMTCSANWSCYWDLGFYATNEAFVITMSCTGLSNVTADRSPVANTEGNANSYLGSS